MTASIATGPVHHLRLTVSDVARSRAFYTEVLGFQHVTDLPSGGFLSNCAVGLDHLSFQVAGREELERAVLLLDQRGVPHGEITDLGEGFGILILAFRDPDNIQLELTAAYG